MSGTHDWKKETVDLLCAYLRINTTNPPGNETKAAAFFADIFKHEGIEHTVWESKPGRGSIMARIGRAKDAKSPDKGRARPHASQRRGACREERVEF